MDGEILTDFSTPLSFCKAMESEVNVFKNELQGPQPGHQLLTNQISRLCVCLDVYLETEGQDDGVEGPREFPREKMCLRIVRYNYTIFTSHAANIGRVSGSLTFVSLSGGPIVWSHSSTTTLRASSVTVRSVHGIVFLQCTAQNYWSLQIDLLTYTLKNL